MRKFRKLTIGMIGAVLLSTGLYSCNNDDVVEVTNQSGKELNVAHREVEETIPEVQQYFNNLKLIIFATEINKIDVVNSLGEDDGIPLVKDLQNLHLTDVDTDKQISFYDMEELYQVSYIDQHMDESARLVSGKVRLMPELIESFASQNRVIKEILSENNITSIETKAKDRKKIFDDFNVRIGEVVANTPPRQLPHFPVPPVDNGTKTRNLLASMNAQRGDILVSLPKRGFKFQLVSTENEQFAVGHTGILTKDITSSTSIYEEVSVEAWRVGLTSGTVRRRQIAQKWHSANFYLMELKERRGKVKFTWRKGVHVSYSYHNINKNAFASKGESYLGRPYLYNIQDFLHMKGVARIFNRFACTSHVWFAAKKSVSVNVSNPLSEIVTPSDIFSDSETFLKGTITNYF